MSPVWHIKVEGVAPVITDFHEDRATIEDVRTRVLETVKEAVDWTEGDDLELDEALGNIEDATDVKSFDEAMAELYDWADVQRVWIDPTR